jgi:hypothetical protein
MNFVGWFYSNSSFNRFNSQISGLRFSRTLFYSNMQMDLYLISDYLKGCQILHVLDAKFSIYDMNCE